MAAIHSSLPCLLKHSIPMPSIPPPRTLINSLEPEEERQRSSVDKTQIPHDRLRNVSGMLRALKVISPTLVGPLSSPFAQSISEGVSHVLGLSEGLSKLIPIDEQPNHQIVHLFRLGKTNRAA